MRNAHRDRGPAEGNRVEVIAPFGVNDLIGLIVRPTPHFASKLHIYRERLREKNWISRWPKLRVDPGIRAPS